MSNAVIRSSLCGAPYCLNYTIPKKSTAYPEYNKSRVTFIYIIITYFLKEQGMFLKKHYEIPFLKECALLFCLLHKILTERDKLYKGMSCSSLYRVKHATGYIVLQEATHRLSSEPSDDLNVNTITIDSS